MRESGPVRTPSVMSNAPVAVVAMAVLAAYVYFGSAGTFGFQRVPWDRDYTGQRPGLGYYASLGEGFLRGQVSLPQDPDPRLAELRDPYKFEARRNRGIGYLWDASYFRGKYYLYFSAVPVFLFYIPFRAVAQGWPADALAGTFFASWSFLAALTFLRRALPRPQFLALPLAAALLGTGNVVLFTLNDVSVYEVAILAGMAMGSMWALSLLELLQRPSRWNALMSGVWLSLAAATRPNLIVLVVPTAIALVLLRDVKDRSSIAALAAAPLVVTALALAAYNTARFGNPLELGVTYQLTYVPMRDHPVCRLCTPREAARFVNGLQHYVFWPISFGGDFPFVDMSWNRLDRWVSFPGSQQVAGVFPLIPLAVLGSMAAAFLLLLRDRDLTAGAETRASLLVTTGAWLVLAGLSACWWVTARYSLDFMTLMTIGSIVCLERGIEWLSLSGVRVRPLRLMAAALACYSVLLGMLLGFLGPNGAYANNNPDHFRRLSHFFYVAFGRH
jgi:hypothetical protein